MQTVTPAAYLARIGLSADPVAHGRTGEHLQRIATAHLATVPFENLAIHAGEPATVALEALLDKIVRRRRGGICYELNGALGWLLEQLGWSVAYHGARVLRADGTPGLPLAHLALVVGDGAGPTQPGGRWLVDVGFGGDLIIGPLEQTVPELLEPEPLEPGLLESGLLELGLPAPGAGRREATQRDVEVRQPSGEVVDYQLERVARPLADFAAMAWWHSSFPGARFTSSLICTLTRDARRYTLAGRRLKVSATSAAATGTVLEERDLRDAAEVLRVYRRTYGIDLVSEPVAAEFTLSVAQRQSVANGTPR